jgi:apolipoprotein N-acyltransferase
MADPGCRERFAADTLAPGDYLLAFLTSILLFIGFPPLNASFAAFVALVPILGVLRRRAPRAAFWLGFWAGFAFSLGVVYWIVLVPVDWRVRPLICLGVVLLAGYLAIYWGIFCCGAALVRTAPRITRVLVLPALLVALEYVRSLSSLGFPWGLLGYTQAGHPALIQFGAVTGIWGVSFWVALVNTVASEGVFECLRPRPSLAKSGGSLGGRIIPFAVCVLLLFVPWIQGRTVLSRQPQGPTVRVALIQGNIPMDVKWDTDFIDYNIETYLDMSREAAAEKPDLIVWPETAIPVVLRYEPRIMHRLLGFGDSLGIPILTGVPEVIWKNGRPQDFNRAVLLQAGRVAPETYDKIRLVPFSERLPFLDLLPVLRRVDLGQAEFTPGSHPTVFEVSGIPFSVIICFEAIFPDLVRRFIGEGARLLVNITNDTWFGRTPAPYVHAAMAAFRAVEVGTPVARCANSGVSMLVDSRGRVLRQTALFRPAIVVGTLNLRQEATFYARHGDYFPLLCFLLLGVTGLPAGARALRPQMTRKKG